MVNDLQGIFQRLPLRRDKRFWIVAVVLLALSYGGHRVVSAELTAKNEALKVEQTRLQDAASAEHSLRLRAEAAKSVTDAALSTAREAGRLASNIARQDQRRASDAILGLGSTVDSLEAAGDSTVAIVLVREIQTEHQIERDADAIIITALEADTTAMSNALVAADTVIVRQSRELFFADSLSQNFLAQTAVQDARLSLALNPPFTVDLVRGSKWIVLGAVAGFLLAGR